MLVNYLKKYGKHILRPSFRPFWVNQHKLTNATLLCWKYNCIVFFKTLLHYLKIIPWRSIWSFTVYEKERETPAHEGSTDSPHYPRSLCTFKGQTQVGHSSMITGNGKSRVFTRMSIPDHEFWREPRLGKNYVSYPDYSYVPRSSNQWIG